MGHHIEAIITGKQVALDLAKRFKHANIVRLRQEMFLIPLTELLFDEMNTIPSVLDTKAEGIMSLSKRVEMLLAEFSKRGPIAFVMTEYFGGNGEQSTAVWHGGQRVFGPRLAEIGPINEGLRILGVNRDGYHDEFDALGLGDFRRMDSFDAHGTGQ